MAIEAAGTRRKGWLVSESDFGGPMVEHVHADGSAVAYVLPGRNGRDFAQCSRCGQRKALAPPDEKASAPAV